MNTKDSIRALERQLDKAPHSPQLWEKLADLYLQKEQVDKAIDAYEFAIAIDPKRESALFKRSLAYMITDNKTLRDKGKDFLEAYCQRHPEEPELRKMLDYIEVLCDKVNFTPELPLPFDDSVTDHTIDWDMLRDPQTPYDEYMETVDMLFDGRYYQKAREVLDILLPLHPDEGILYLDYGSLLMQDDNIAQAENYFKKALLKVSKQDRDFFLGEIGFQYFAGQLYPEALDYYHRIENIQEVRDHLPYMAACCLELNYPLLYHSYLAQIDPENNEDDYNECHQAFYGHLPNNLLPKEMKPFLKQLFDRYNT